MSVVRIKKAPKNYHGIDLCLAKKIGLEKAVIICNIEGCYDTDGSKTKFSRLYTHFIYFTRAKFYSLIQELIEDGQIEISGEKNV